MNWKNEQRKVSELKPVSWNPRKISEEQLNQLKKSIEKFNLVEVPAVNLNGNLLAGHQRVKALILLGRGDEMIDVRVPDRLLTEEEEKEYNVRSNHNVGEFDNDLLAQNFSEDLLKDIGFDSKELDKIFDLDLPADVDDVPEVRQETDIKLGDIFQLGNHKLMCADSTKEEDVAKLMNGEKADMVFTDPPYNVDYGTSKKPRHKYRIIENDKQSPEDWEKFCKSIFGIFKNYNNGDIYMWGASAPEGMKMRLWLTELGCHWSATIIWVKDQLVLTPANYQRMYEPCFYGWFDKSSFNGDRKQTEVWEIARPKDSKLHPTMKPIELCCRAIDNSSLRDGIVLDLFGGSGSTLIACEQTNRRCNMMELDPVYCQVIVDRWEKLTNKKAVKIN